MTTNKTKVAVGALTVSAAFFASLIQYEGFRAKPYYDSGKVATIGIGSTKYEDGSKVKITDPAITKQRAENIVRAHIKKEEDIFKKSVGDKIKSQVEYDLYMDFVYQFGTGTWEKSSMLRDLKAGKSKQACADLLKYKYVGRRDCSVRKNGCYGVWTRQQERYNKCMGVN
jgi:GH24 family phage-related lysozyme (muramidase)